MLLNYEVLLLRSTLGSRYQAGPIKRLQYNLVEKLHAKTKINEKKDYRIELLIEFISFTLTAMKNIQNWKSILTLSQD